MDTGTERSAPRWALVAGGSGGLGAAICRALAEDGWHVALTYRKRADAAEQVAAEVEVHGVRAAIEQLDLTDAAATAEVIGRITGGDPLGGVVYASGPHVSMRFLSTISPEAFATQMTGDAIGCYNLVHHSLPYLRPAGGAVVSLSSAGVHRFPKRDVLSAAPKAAVELITRAVAVEEGRFGVRANCVRVGVIEGPGMWSSFHEQGDYTPESLAIARQQTPLQRFGSVEDVAEATRFLLSDRAGWITAQTLSVDGGFTA